jgi:hypothetical protein
MVAPAEADPIQIGTADQLNAFRTQVLNNNNAETKFDAELTDNITIENWVGAIGLNPNISTNFKPYNGTFDGKHYKITLINEGLNHDEAFALFHTISTDAVVQNLEMEVKAKGTTTSVILPSISTVAMRNYGTIKNVTVNCAILGTSFVSGVANANYGRIEYATVNGWIEVTGNTSQLAAESAGIAVINYSNGVISHCVNNATIKAGGGMFVGGLVADLNGRLEYSANHGDVIQENKDGYGMATGGLVGYINNQLIAIGSVLSADIYNCYNAGNVSGPSADYYVGGLVGGHDGAFKADCGIVNSFNYGTVTVNSGQSAAILGTPSGVTVQALGSSRNVYYLNTSAGLRFGTGSGANSAQGIEDKFISKTADDFKTAGGTLYNALIGGPGGDEDEEGNDVWAIGFGDFPTLYGLSGMPESKFVESPFEAEEPEPSPYPLGYATENNEPMIINNEDDLDEFAEIIKDGGNYQDAILSADLYLEEWTSIAPLVLGSGKEPPAYKGTFDGQGHTIEMTKTGNIVRTALFYSIGTGGLVKDLVVSVDFVGTSSFAAGVAVKHGGRIERVKTYGRIITTTGGIVGGLVAESSNLSDTLYECANYADITAEFYLGGLAGRFSGTMEYCANYGNITSQYGQPCMGGLTGAFAFLGSSTYSNCYNAGTVSVPDKPVVSGSNGVGGLWGFAGLTGQASEPDYPGYFRSYATNLFSYGDVALSDGKGAIIDGGKFGEDAFVNVENFFYRTSAGSRVAWVLAGATEDDGWGTDYVKTKITGLDDDAFTDGTLLAELNAHESGQKDGEPRWGQGENFPELLVFNPGLPTDVTEPQLTPGTAARTSATAATVKFTSDEDGAYYYAVMASGAAAPDIDTDEAGTPLTAGELTTITVSDLESGAYDLYIAVKDAAGNVSESLKITIPAYAEPGAGDPITPIEPEPEEPVEDEPIVEDPIEDEPETPVFEIDDGSGEEPPAVVISIDPDKDVEFIPDTGVETVTVPALTQEAIDVAIEKANEAGTEPAVIVPVKKPIDPVTNEPVEVSEVHVEISVSDLITAAENEVNIRINVFEGEGGEITLNSDALRDLIDRAGGDSETVVEVIIAKEDEAKLAELPPEQRETLSDLSGDEGKVRAVYDISVAVGPSRLRDFETNGTLTIGLPYKLNLEAGEVGERVLSYYIPEEGSAEPMTVGSWYSDARSLSIFETKHLSVYAVAYESETVPSPEEDDPKNNGGGGCDAGIGAFALVLMGSAAILRKRGKP